MANKGGGFHIQEEKDDYDVDEIYGLYPTLFSINMHHGGSFTNNPGHIMSSSVMNDFDPFLDDNDRDSNEDSDTVDENNQDDNDMEEDSDQDSDYIVDEENDIDESDVDMRDYKFMVDDEEEDETHPDARIDDLEVLDNEKFDSASDIEDNIGNVRRRTLKHIKREHVETRRLLKIVKDDKDRVRVACSGDIPGVDKVESVKRPKKKKVKKN
ncbi:coiled-coil domain-containing protein 1-like [Helianthus annuus]|uniref:coiled-coil domain-containing protein 1-like n=1 Tax=Helianthus annuus TaxID=4232 RepID=UPI000B908A30|nr:coiled-coil domain-containing protein 1-like [Helianthus annuus]